jgi:RNA polymerase sigma-70 factor (ECF subfamily)
MSATDVRGALEAAYRNEGRHVLATLIRLLGSFDAAEEAMHEAFAAATEQWPREGVPLNPYAWLVSAGRFKTIDRWRRQARLARALPDLTAVLESAAEPAESGLVQDDELRLIFICCHPVLAPDARIALTLREVGGLTTEEIARAYLVPAPTIAQRIVRAKAKIRDEAIPFEMPTDLPARLEGVLHVVYLIFNEGYATTRGPEITRGDLCAGAIRLGRLIVDLLDEPEALGLLALMLLHEARLATRVDAAGDLVLLEDQDRSLWNREKITEARQLITRAMASRQVGAYTIQAAIIAAHAVAANVGETDWRRIVTLYDLLVRAGPSPIVALNRAVALGMRDGPAAGLAAIDVAFGQGGLDDYHLAHAARGDMQRRLGLVAAAEASYRRAMELVQQPAERRFLQRRLDQLALASGIATGQAVAPHPLGAGD